MDDPYDLLARLNGLDDFLAERLRFDAVNKIANDLEIYVCVQQRQPYFAKRVADVGFRNLAEPSQIAKGILKLATDRIEHGGKISAKRGVQSAIWKGPRLRRSPGP